MPLHTVAFGSRGGRLPGDRTVALKHRSAFALNNRSGGMQSKWIKSVRIARIFGLDYQPFQGNDPRREALERFIEVVSSRNDYRYLVHQVTTLSDLLSFSRRIGTPIEEIDIILYYRDLNEWFWPWAGMSKQARRHFVHERKLPERDPGCFT